MAQCGFYGSYPVKVKPALNETRATENRTKI